MPTRGCIVLAALCGCAGLGPVTGWESRPVLASPLTGYTGRYVQEAGGWDARIGLVLPYADKDLIPLGLRGDLVWVKYFKAETFSVEPSLGAYVLFNQRGDESGGQLLVVPITCVAKYFFELIYKSGLKIYLGAGLGVYYGQAINTPEVELSDVAFGFPLCFGVQVSREDKTAIEIEFRFDSPVFDAEAKEPGLPIWRPGEADLGVTFISVNWKGVF